MPEPFLSVIIPVFNKWDLTRQCLESLAQHTPGENIQVIVADNGSTDETAEQLQVLGSRLFGQRFTRLRFEENRNFAGGCNAGAAKAGAGLLFFLNNDTLVTPNWLPPLVERLEADPQPGMVGPLLLYPDNRVQHMGVVLNATGYRHLYRLFPKDHRVVRRPRRLQALTAAALLVPKELFGQCGGFHEEYRNGFEDLELSLRVREAGKKLACAPDSVVYHLESQSPGRNRNDRFNAGVLGRRCGGRYFIDLHHHALADGFAVRLEADGGLSVQLPDEEDRELLASCKDLPLEEQFAVLRNNPVWRTGYDLVAGGLERAGQIPQALYIRVESTMFFHSRGETRKLLRLAESAGEKTIAEKARQALADFDDVALQTGRHRQFLARAIQHSDAWLVDLYTRRLAELKAK